MKSRELQIMREKLITLYPSGIIRGQRIADMPECQVYAIYKSHTARRIPMNKARMEKQKQVPGQTSILNLM